jgi:hypothetical protein
VVACPIALAPVLACVSKSNAAVFSLPARIESRIRFGVAPARHFRETSRILEPL